MMDRVIIGSGMVRSRGSRDTQKTSFYLDSLSQQKFERERSRGKKGGLEHRVKSQDEETFGVGYKEDMKWK